MSANTAGLAVTEHFDLEERAGGLDVHDVDVEERPGYRDLLDVETARACSLQECAGRKETAYPLWT